MRSHCEIGERERPWGRFVIDLRRTVPAGVPDGSDATGASKRLGRAIGQVGARWLRSCRSAIRLMALRSPAPGSSQDAPGGGPPESQGAARSAYGTVGVPARIALRATADSWIQVRDADRRVLFSGVLKSAEGYSVPEQAGLLMRAGNAGGLDVTVDGQTCGIAGSDWCRAQRRARSAIAGGDDRGAELSATRLPASFVRRRNDLYACFERLPERGR